ncbi:MULTISPECIES: hypothetical protein [Streptomyces]|uniref:Uncharacterized protein n=4 Tax=Streptomyces TaxID=1883 RepID=A0ABW9ICC8_STRGJ|nr:MULTISPECIES: hypothetical protein [Streptomyces]MBD9702103.1 hypothetical protein [Streptomyces caniscabiei]MBD9722734.1 hypothetical protein [Streptomyces caniscabiei]MBE4738803.1 hypothetical protein [Streptomyces caniscabiei]MBE4758057.1 hypothetical protein [Streptomyces caniscabiei]MBE4772097.1 hypothetical protein [Streptomyces caniscabiei]
MVFYRIRLTQRMNAYWAMEAESEELYELAQALLDPSMGYVTLPAGFQDLCLRWRR